MAITPTVATIAVIGAGATGRAIAHRAALAGYRTILEDILPASLRKAESELCAYLNDSVGQGSVTRADAESALRRLEYVGSVEAAAREADLVIDAVPDEMESKLEIFTLLDKICRPDTILASTATSLSVSEIASITYRPQKILGMRFLPSTPGTKLQLVRTRETSDETVAACTKVGLRMSGEVVVITEESA